MRRTHPGAARQLIGPTFDGRTDDPHQRADAANRHAGADAEQQRLPILPVRQQRADEPGQRVADGAIGDAQQVLPHVLSRAQAQCWREAHAVGEELSGRRQHREHHAEPPAENRRDTDAVAEAANRTEARVGESRRRHAAAGARKLDGERDTHPERGGPRKPHWQKQDVAGEEHPAVGDRARQSPQGAVLAAEKLVGKIQGAEQIERGAGERDRRNDVVVDAYHRFEDSESIASGENLGAVPECRCVLIRLGGRG